MLFFHSIQFFHIQFSGCYGSCVIYHIDFIIGPYLRMEAVLDIILNVKGVLFAAFREQVYPAGKGCETFSLGKI